jgi:hypothetical protein
VSFCCSLELLKPFVDQSIRVGDFANEVLGEVGFELPMKE